MSKNTILATDEHGNDITVNDVEAWIKSHDQGQLSKLVTYRLYSRYLKPFDYQDSDYQCNYKNGFAIMANCCLLIESYVSFKEPSMKSTYRQSERCFGIFFTSEKRFVEFSKDGLLLADYLNPNIPMKSKNVGIPKEFYFNVRNGLLHAGETRHNWKIVRSGDFFDEMNRRINATEFMVRMKETILNYQEELEAADINKSVIWKTYLDKLNDIIAKT